MRVGKAVPVDDKDAPRRDGGFILPLALAIAALVLLLGLAGVYLANSNLRSARSVRLQSQAKYAADGGVGHALAFLSAVPSGQAWPVSLQDVLQGMEVTTTIQPQGADYQITAVATGPQQTRYRSVAIVALNPGGTVNPVFGEGLVSQQNVTLDGASTVNGTVHGNTGFTLNGPLRGSASVTASPGATCNASGNNRVWCQGGTPTNLVPPVTIGAPPIQTLWNSQVPKTCDVTLTSQVVINSQSDVQNLLEKGNSGTAKQPLTVCMGSNNLIINASSISLTDLTVVAGSVDVNGSGLSLTDSNLVVQSANLSGGTELDNSGIFALDTLNANGTLNADGASTLLTGGNFTFDGAARMQLNDGLAVIAGGNLTFNGASTSSAVFWTGGTFTYDGSATLNGDVVAAGPITANGSAAINSEVIQNPHLPKSSGGLVQLLSWR
jgi:hypothetical protein